jgi:hypothetical protein
MNWRYQVVWNEESGMRAYAFCEVYLDAQGRLEAWTEQMIRPGGEDLADLQADLAHMMLDACRWQAVAFSALHKGMTFEELPYATQAAQRLLTDS